MPDFNFFVSRHYNGLVSISQNIQNHLSDDDVEVYIRLYVMLYADDTIILAESPTDVQSALDAT